MGQEDFGIELTLSFLRFLPRASHKDLGLADIFSVADCHEWELGVLAVVKKYSGNNGCPMVY
jgi:hypothetical protein